MNVLTISQTLKYYKRGDVEDALLASAEHREVGVRYGDQGFGKRPDILTYKDDILSLAQKRATSFHSSEELWSNPLLLRPDLTKKELNSLRIGWDLVFDIDCHFFNYSKFAAEIIIDILKRYRISSFSVKYSGNKGFHIGVPFEAFPKKIQGVETRFLFPEAPRRIATYIKFLVKEKLAERILKFEHYDFDSIVKKVGRPKDDLIYYKKGEFDDMKPMLNPEPFLDIDTILISSRHMFRMPYSLHEKSGLASIPIDSKRIGEFSKEEANPEKVVVDKRFTFLDRKKAVEGEASSLIMQAFDFTPKVDEKKASLDNHKEFEIISNPLSREYFAPCIKNILSGVDDGRKRSVFVLINYLSSLGWNFNDIKDLLLNWNKRNKEPLRENYIIQQLNYRKNHSKKVLPPNCSNKMYYKDIGVCTPDNLCGKIRNPVNYSIIKMKDANKNKANKTKTKKQTKKNRPAEKKKVQEQSKNKAGD